MKEELILKKWTQTFLKMEGFLLLGRYKLRGKMEQLNGLSPCSATIILLCLNYMNLNSFWRCKLLGKYFLEEKFLKLIP